MIRSLESTLYAKLAIVLKDNGLRSKLIDVLDGSADWMRLEPPDAEGKIVELWCGEERLSNTTK